MTQKRPIPDLDVLREFLGYPLAGTEAIFTRFSALPGARLFGTGRERALFIGGNRPAESGCCLLVAHADTVWDVTWQDRGYGGVPAIDGSSGFIEKNGVIRSGIPGQGIGADDRAGLAMLWLLRNSGHSLLVTDLEEHGRLGSHALRDHHPDALAAINRDHAFAIQLDRRGGGDFKCYGVGTDAFRNHVTESTGYTEPDRRSFADICTLCDPADGVPAMCGVNLSVGYHDEHTEGEHLVIAEWLHTLGLLRHWLAQPAIPSFRR